MRVLTHEGYTPQPRTSGSHVVFEKEGCKSIPVSASKNIPKGTLRNIIKQMGLSRDEFLAIWNEL